MKKIILFIIIFFISNIVNASTNVAYLDVQFIIDNSNLGKFYRSEIEKLQNKNNSAIILKENEIKKKEEEFKNKKNLLNQDEIKKKIDEINSMVKQYQILRNDLNKKLAKEKKKFSKEILLILNPLLTEYVESKNINLVIEKKNVLVGVKSLDITKNILVIFNERTKNKKNSNDS
jgi:outer membrane protein